MEDSQQALDAIAKSLGFALVACVINLWLLGISCGQTYQYFRYWPNDHLALKSFVGFILLANVGESVNLIFVVWYYCIKHFGNFEYASRASPFLIATPSLIGGLCLFIQSFLMLRLYSLTPYRWAILPIGLTVLGSFFGSLMSSGAVARISVLAELRRGRPVITLWLAGAAVADFLLTVGLLHAFKIRRTGFSEDERLLTRFARRTMTSGAATAFSSIVCLILFLLPSGPIGMGFLVPSWLTSKLYVMSMLVVLLSRNPRKDEEARLDKKDGIELVVITSTTKADERVDKTDSVNNLAASDVSSSRDPKRKKSFKDRILEQSFTLTLNNMIKPDTHSININHETTHQVDSVTDLERALVREDSDRYQHLRRGKQKEIDLRLQSHKGRRLDSFEEESIIKEKEDVEQLETTDAKESYYSRTSSVMILDEESRPSSSLTLNQSQETLNRNN